MTKLLVSAVWRSNSQFLYSASQSCNWAPECCMGHAVWSELMASFSAGYRDAVSHGLSHVHFERSAAALVPISVLTCVPFFDWLEGSGISAELSTLSIPAIQPLHPGGGPRHRMGWYFRTRAVLMLEGLRRVASVVGADEHAALAQSVYFAAGATGQRHQRGGMGRTVRIPPAATCTMLMLMTRMRVCGLAALLRRNLYYDPVLEGWERTNVPGPTFERPLPA